MKKTEAPNFALDGTIADTSQECSGAAVGAAQVGVVIFC